MMAFQSKSFFLEPIGIKVEEESDVAIDDSEDNYGISLNQAPVKNQMEGGENANEYMWTAKDEVHLLSQVSLQIPPKDELPYEETVKIIQWEKISVGNKSVLELKSHLNKILERTRNFRLLKEMVVDAENCILNTMDLPKKYSTPFNLFLAENKNTQLLNLKVGTQRGEYSKKSAEIFLALPVEKREEYKLRAAAIRAEYRAALAKITPESELKRKGHKSETPFGLFYSKQKLQNRKISYSDVRKQYISLSNTEKLKWILESLQTTHGQKLDKKTYQKSNQLLNKNEMTILKEYEGRPKKCTAYALFVKNYFSNKKNVDKTSRNAMKAVSKCWKDLSTEAKNEYEQSAMAMKKTYDIKYKEFVKSLPSDRREMELSKKKIDGEKSENKQIKSNLFSSFKNSNKKQMKVYRHAENITDSEVVRVPDPSRFVERSQKSKPNFLVKNVDENISNQSESISGSSNSNRNYNEKLISDRDEISANLEINSKSSSNNTRKFDNKENSGGENIPVEGVAEGVFDRNSTTTVENRKKRKLSLSTTNTFSCKKTRSIESDDRNEDVIYQISNNEKPIEDLEEVVPNSTSLKEEMANIRSKIKISRMKLKLKRQNLSNKAKNNVSFESSSENLDLNRSNSVKTTFDNDSMYLDFENIDANFSAITEKNKFRKEAVFDKYMLEVEAKINSLQSNSDKDCLSSFIKMRPPRSVFKFFVRDIFNGEECQAKNVYKTMTVAEMESLERKYERAKKKYLKSFGNYLKTLSAEEMITISNKYKDGTDKSTDGLTNLDSS